MFQFVEMTNTYLVLHHNKHVMTGLLHCNKQGKLALDSLSCNDLINVAVISDALLFQLYSSSNADPHSGWAYREENTKGKLVCS